MDRNLALEMVRVTEASALAAARWMGKGDPVSADQAAVDAMHLTLNSQSIDGRIALGMGESGAVPKLYTGEEIGAGGPNHIELAIDPLECTKSVAYGRSNAMAVVAMAPPGEFFSPPSQYMEKLAVGPQAAGVIDLSLSIEENLSRIAKAKGYAIADLTVVILDRERHADMIARIRKLGARIHLIPDGDVAAAIAAATPGTGIDVLVGTGGSSEGVLAAAALRCIGGEIQTRLAPSDRQETDELRRTGYGNLSRVYRAADLVRGDNVMFVATGVTDGDLLNGVNYRADGATTHSLVLRSKTKTKRFIVTEHYFEDNPLY